MSVAPKGSKLAKFINSRVKVVVLDRRYFIGQMLSFDTHSNIVLKDCEEYRPHNRRKNGKVIEEKKSIGLMVLRGETISHIGVVGPPPPSGNRLSATTASYVLMPGSTSGNAHPTGAGLGNLETPSTNEGLSKPAMGIGASSVRLDVPAKPVLPAANLPQ